MPNQISSCSGWLIGRKERRFRMALADSFLSGREPEPESESESESESEKKAERKKRGFPPLSQRSQAVLHQQHARGCLPPSLPLFNGSVKTRLNAQFSNSQFSILNSQFSILNSQFSMLNSQFSTLNFQFSILNS